MLEISTSVNRRKWDENKYEAFLDELCENREYQKEAIRTAMRYLLGGEYRNLRNWWQRILNITKYCAINTAQSETWRDLCNYQINSPPRLIWRPAPVKAM